MKSIRAIISVAALAAACGGGSAGNTPAPEQHLVASAAELDSMWARTDRRLDKHDWREAAVLLQRLMLEMSPRDSRMPRARLLLGEARLQQKSYLQAVREFRRVADEYPNDSLAPRGLLRAGDSYAKLWRRPELDPTYGGQAMATWRELLNRYPDSPLADSANQRIAHLNEWYAIKEYKNAQFYMRYKSYSAAIIYLKDLVAKYPRTSKAPQAMVLLIEAFHDLGYVEDVQEMCRFFQTNYPQHAGDSEWCPAQLSADSAAGS